MATSPIESVVNAWNVRGTQAKALGIPDDAVQSLAHQDIQNVMSGGAAMPAQSVNVALLAQKLGRPVVPDPKRGTGILNTLGNIPHDIEDVSVGFVPGLVKYLYHLPTNIQHGIGVTPQEAVQKYGYEPEQPGIADNLRNLAFHNPITSFLPLIHTAAGLTTSEGRKELQRHPVSSLLDILPVLSDVGGAAGFLAKGGEDAAAGTATEALQQGHPVRAAFRAVTDLPERIPGAPRVATRAYWNEQMANMGINEAVREGLSRPFSVIQRKADRQMKSFLDNEILPHIAKMPEEERAAMTEYLVRRKAGETNFEHPEWDAIGHVADQLNQQFFEKGAREGQLVTVPVEGVDKPVVYSTESPVPIAHTKLVNAQEAVGRLTNRLENARDVLDKWRDNHLTRQGKVRGFMENPEDFNARPVGPVGPEVVKEAARPFVEAFQHLDPEAVFREYLDKIQDGKVRAQTAGYLMRDFRALKGEDGLVAKFDEALQSGDVKGASANLTKINRVLRHTSWDDFDTTTRIRSHVADLREEMVGLRKRTTSFGFASRMVRNAEARVGRYEDALAKAQERVSTRRGTFMEQLSSHPPQNFRHLIIDRVREGASDQARMIYFGDQLTATLDQIKVSPTMTELEKLMGGEGFKDLMDDTVRSWVDLARDGYDPVFLHHVPASRIDTALRPRILPDQELDPGQWRSTVLNFAPGVMDIGIGLSAAAAELIAKEGTHQFLQNLQPFIRSKDEVRAELQQALQGDAPRPTLGVMGQVEKELKKNYRDFDPERFGIRSSNIAREGMVVPVGVDRALNAYVRGFQYIPIRGVFDRTMKVYKYSVLFGPKHLAHVLLGGMMTMGLSDPGALLKIGEASRMALHGEIPDELNHEFFDFQPDHVQAFKGGQTMGRLLSESLGSKANAMARLQETISNVYRTATYISEHERQIKGGASETIAREAALRSGHKLLIDMDGQSWLERSIVRNVLPFYSFTRFLVKYALSYPADHPLRAAFLSALANQEQRDWNNGMAKKFQLYFFLGEPNAKGDVKAVDYRSLNPFRSLGSMFTFAGLISSINPLVSAPFGASGLNTLSATPELYPDMAYDPTTGSLVPRREGTAQKIAGAILPQINSLDIFLARSDAMKRLKERNPDAYRRLVWQQFHLPFVAGNVNVPLEEERAEMARVAGGSGELAKALQTGNFERVNRYNLVAFHGQLVDPHQIESLWNLVHGALGKAGVTGLNPKAILPNS